MVERFAKLRRTDLIAHPLRQEYVEIRGNASSQFFLISCYGHEVGSETHRNSAVAAFWKLIVLFVGRRVVAIVPPHMSG